MERVEVAFHNATEMAFCGQIFWTPLSGLKLLNKFSLINLKFRIYLEASVSQGSYC